MASNLVGDAPKKRRKSTGYMGPKGGISAFESDSLDAPKKWFRGKKAEIMERTETHRQSIDAAGHKRIASMAYDAEERKRKRKRDKREMEDLLLKKKVGTVG